MLDDLSSMKTKRKIERLEIVSKLFKRGYSRRKIRAEVMKRLDLPSYSLQTVQRDIATLLEEWREERLNDTEALVNMELARIDTTCQELWEQWDKSKENFVRTVRKQTGAPKKDEKTKQDVIKTYKSEKTETDIQGLGDVSYITEIRHQLEERRKLLGLYAAEKKEVTGELSFASLLVESGMLDEAPESEAEE